MNRSRGGKALTNLVVAIVAAAGLSLVGWWFFHGEGGDEGQELITTTVFAGPYEHIITEQGTVENATNVELQCEVKSRAGQGSGIAIISVVPEGTLVEVGDTVVELDSSALEQDRVTQLIQVAGQKSLLIQAENKLAAAKIARREYELGTFAADESLLTADEYVAQKVFNSAESSLEQSRRLFARGVITSTQVEAAQFAVEDARNRHAAVKTKLGSLRMYTREKMLKTFDSDIATAMADVSAEQAKLSLEESKLNEIMSQIAKCTIRAPVAGEVVHANEYDSNNGIIEADFVVQAGALVRERQPLVRLPSSGDMQVRATVGQARVTRVRPGMPVTIRVDAHKEGLIQGEITKINPYADPAGFSSGNIKKYATFVKIHDPPPGIRSGMNAEVRIHLEQRESAVQVPVQALAQYEGRFFSLVCVGEEYETREVHILSTNDKVATVAEGLEEGEVVVMSPRRAGSLFQLPEVAAKEAPALATSPRSKLKAGGMKGQEGGLLEPAGGGE